MPKLGEASVEIEVDLAKYRRQLREAQKITKRMASGMVKSLDRVGRKLTTLGKSFSTRLSAPMALAGVAIGKITSDFDRDLSMIVGLVGIAEKQVIDWRKEILKLGPAVGKGPGELADGLFFVTSAGFRSSAALNMLEQSAKAASAGLGETKSVAKAAGAAVNAYGAENLAAGKAIGILVGTIREGVLETASLGNVIGQVLPFAAALGVTFDQVGASIAAMTRLGLPAEEAVTSLKATFSAFAKPADDAKKAIKDMGLNFDQLKEDLRKPQGLLNVLSQLSDASKRTGIEMVRVFPNIRAFLGVLSLVGENVETTKKIFQALSEDGVETLNSAFAVAAKTSGFKFNQAMVRIQNTMIRLGDVLLPVVVPLITELTQAIDRAGIAFSKLSANTKTWIVLIAGIAIALGPVLITIGLLVIGLAGLVVVMGKVITVAIFMGKAVVKSLMAIVSVPGLIIIAFLALATALFVFKQTVTGLATGISEAFKKAFVTQFNNDVVRPFAKAINKVIGFINDVFTAFKKMFITQFNSDVVKPFIKLINSMFDILPDKLREVLGIVDKIGFPDKFNEALGVNLIDKITVPDIIEGTFVDDMGKVMKKAFATGKVEAANFVKNVQRLLSTIGDAFTLGTGVGPLAELEKQFERLKKLIEDVGKASEDAGEKMDVSWKEAAENSKIAVAESLEDMIVNFESLSTIISSLAATIRDELIRALIAKPIANFIAGIVGTAFGLPGKKAGGGQVNSPTIVGERGPELFIPSGTGKILNNANSISALSKGAGPITVIQHITFTADVQNSVRAEIANAAPILSSMAAEKVFETIGRQAS